MMNRKNSTIVGNYDDIEIVGFKSQFTKVYGITKENCFMELTIGDSLNEEPKLEGIKKNNFIGTHVIRPNFNFKPIIHKKANENDGRRRTKISIRERNNGSL